jgi:hypothetical protein
LDEDGESAYPVVILGESLLEFNLTLLFRLKPNDPHGLTRHPEFINHPLLLLSREACARNNIANVIECEKNVMR